MLVNQKGFTLIEMLIVLLIITILIILIVPNLAGRSEEVHDKGCDALVSVVQAQVHLYHLEKGKFPESLDALADEDYISDSQTTCQNKQTLNYDKDTGLVMTPDETS